MKRGSYGIPQDHRERRLICLCSGLDTFARIIVKIIYENLFVSLSSISRIWRNINDKEYKNIS